MPSMSPRPHGKKATELGHKVNWCCKHENEINRDYHSWNLYFCPLCLHAAHEKQRIKIDKTMDDLSDAVDAVVELIPKNACNFNGPEYAWFKAAKVLVASGRYRWANRQHTAIEHKP